MKQEIADERAGILPPPPIPKLIITVKKDQAGRKQKGNVAKGKATGAKPPDLYDPIPTTPCQLKWNKNVLACLPCRGCGASHSYATSFNLTLARCKEDIGPLHLGRGHSLSFG